MDGQANRGELPAQKLVFFGTITASLSHELKNALATINEYAGLLDDLAGTAGAGRSLPPDRLKTICTKIGLQVKRSEGLLTRLNRFAHSVDSPQLTVDVGEQLQRICDLCGRFAAMRQVTIERRFDAGTLTVTVDPFALQYAVYLALDLAFRSAGPARQVTVCCEPSTDDPAGGGKIAVRSADPLDAQALAEGLREQLDQLAAHLGATLELSAEVVSLSFARKETRDATR